MERIEEPIECPTCGKPFEMEMPTVEVTGVREVEKPAALDDRTIALETPETTLVKTHPAIFRSHPFVTFILLGLVGACAYGIAEGWTTGQMTIVWASLAGLGAVALVTFVWWLRSVFVTLTVTNNRTILQRGLISRTMSEVQHDDVKNIQLDQSVMERIFRVGDIGISSSGQDDLEIVARDMPNPTRIVELIRANQR
jgi:hypothetical protein